MRVNVVPRWLHASPAESIGPFPAMALEGAVLVLFVFAAILVAQCMGG